jgi:hypothetical protein
MTQNEENNALQQAVPSTGADDADTKNITNLVSV